MGGRCAQRVERPAVGATEHARVGRLGRRDPIDPSGTQEFSIWLAGLVENMSPDVVEALAASRFTYVVGGSPLRPSNIPCS